MSIPKFDGSNPHKQRREIPRAYNDPKRRNVTPAPVPQDYSLKNIPKNLGKLFTRVVSYGFYAVFAFAGLVAIVLVGSMIFASVFGGN